MMEVRESIFSGQTNFFCPVQDSNKYPRRTIRLLDSIGSYLNPGRGSTKGSLVLESDRILHGTRRNPSVGFDRMAVVFQQ